MQVNGVKFEDMDMAPSRERANLARSAMISNMNGPKKSAKFALLRKGEYTGVSALLNQHTKFAKLSVGKHVATAKQQLGSQDPLFPLIIAINGKPPIEKVEVDY